LSFACEKLFSINFMDIIRKTGTRRLGRNRSMIPFTWIPLIAYIFALRIFFGETASAAPMMPTNPISAWLFDEGTGLIALDSFNTHTGTLAGADQLPVWTNSPTAPFTYPANRALAFTGNTSNRVDLGDVTEFSFTDATDAFTLSAWVYLRPGSTANRRSIFSKRRNVSPPPHQLEYSWVFELTNSTLGDNTLRGTRHTNLDEGFRWYGGSVPSDVWVHVAAVFDIAGNDYRIYLNTNLLGTNASFDLAGIDDGYADAMIGNVNHSGSSFYNYGFDGLIDEVALFDYALGPDEIEWLFNNSLNEFFVPEPSEYMLMLFSVNVVLLAWRRRK